MQQGGFGTTQDTGNASHQHRQQRLDRLKELKESYWDVVSECMGRWDVVVIQRLGHIHGVWWVRDMGVGTIIGNTESITKHS